MLQLQQWQTKASYSLCHPNEKQALKLLKVPIGRINKSDDKFQWLKYDSLMLIETVLLDCYISAMIFKIFVYIILSF